MLLVAIMLLVRAVLPAAPPRSLGPAIEYRLADQHPLIAAAGRGIGRWLARLDRGELRAMPGALGIGADEDHAPRPPPAGRLTTVGSPVDLLEALRSAAPGDTIVLADGVYRLSGSHLAVDRPGTKDAPITLRARRLGAASLELDMNEGFLVSAPHWRFEDLVVRGTCASHADCEHAFHVVGAARDFVARNNRITDFNAHFKINGQRGRQPDHGLIENNDLANTTSRRTDATVTTIDLVGASGWIVRGNLIADFVKGQGERISFGAYAKGGGSGNRFERNLVACEWHLRDAPGSRVGLSLGGGGTAAGFCRDRQCAIEQEGGVIDSNLIVGCSDEGIYLNRAASSRVAHNTLLDTGGIVVRFAESSAELEGNLVDGSIRSRDDGLVHEIDNLQTPLLQLYLGRHPQRGLFRDAARFDLAWRGAAPRRSATAAAPGPDLCGRGRPLAATHGAFEDIADCARRTQAPNPLDPGNRSAPVSGTLPSPTPNHLNRDSP